MSEEYQPITIRLKPGSPRADRFQQVFGRLTGIPVVFSEPEIIFDESGKEQKAYILSTVRLTPSEKTNLAIYYADRLHILPDEARSLIKNSVVPINAEDCEVERG